MTQTVIQILSGFLLTVPFQQRLTGLNGPLRALYLVAVALATLSTGLVVAPVAAHRLLFRQHHKAELVTSSDRLRSWGWRASASPSSVCSVWSSASPG